MKDNDKDLRHVPQGWKGLTKVLGGIMVISDTKKRSAREYLCHSALSLSFDDPLSRNYIKFRLNSRLNQIRFFN